MQEMKRSAFARPALWLGLLAMIAASCGQRKHSADNGTTNTPTQGVAPEAEKPRAGASSPSGTTTTTTPSGAKPAPGDVVQSEPNSYPTPVTQPQNNSSPATPATNAGSTYPAVVIPGAATGGNAPAPVVVTPPQGNLFVVISGNGTCNPRLDSRVVPGLWSTDLFDNFVGQVWNRGFVQPNDEVIFICYETLSPRMYFYAAKTQPTMIPIHEAQVDSLVLSRIHNPRKVIFIGYSYGGWRSMKLASSPVLLAATRAPILLVTIDPISRMNCEGPFEAGCHSAPRDFSQQEMYMLSTRTTWLNTFERGSLFVSSGPMSAAHQNLEFGGLHINMAKNGGVWNAIVGFFARFQ